MRIIRTLRGDISPEKVGAVYYHEHVIARSPVTKAREMDLELCDVEKILKEEGLLDETSDLRNTLLVKAIKTERWRKWMMGEQRNLQVEDILKDEALSLEILDISGHYAFNDEDVKKELQQLYANLAKFHIDGQRFVVDHIKRPLQQYAECYNLKGVTSRIRKAIEK